MGGITSNVGIFSGIDTATLIEQLLAIEARPKNLAQRRLVELQSQQSAYLDINSRLLALRTSAADFNAKSVFSATKATSSNTNVLTATASSSASLGSYNLAVARLVSTHQSISRRFADADTSGLGATQFTFEVGKGRVDSQTNLADLSGGDGVQRGKVRITDSSGESAVIDLSTAVTVDDVLGAINASSDISVRAAVSGQGLTLTDLAAAGGSITVEEVSGGSTAASLGLLGSAASGGTISSGDLLFITENTALKSLRDGVGVSFGAGGAAAPADFKLLFTGGAGGAQTVNVVLGDIGTVVDEKFVVSDTAVVTVGDLIDRVEEQTAGRATLAINGAGTGFTIVSNDGDVAFDANSRDTLSELGFDPSAAAGASHAGLRRLAGVNSVLASSLNGGSGVGAGTVRFTARSGGQFNVALTGEESIAEIVAAINSAAAGASLSVAASLNSAGNGLKIVDTTATTGSLVVEDLSGSAGAGLGILTPGASTGVVDSGNLQFRYISSGTLLSELNNGQGVGVGTFRITNARGATFDIKVTASHRTVGDVVSFINSRSNIEVVARVNDNGDGIIIEDDTGEMNLDAISIRDISGTVGKRLNLVGTADFESGGDPAENVIDGSFERPVSFEATDTLREIAQKVNSAGVGVDAAVISDGTGATPWRLIFTSETSGRGGRASVDTQGLDLGLSQLTEARDALVFFGSSDPARAVLISSGTNTLDRVLAGVTIDLNTTSASAVEVVVSRDVTAIETQVDSFVKAFNAVLDRLDFHERFDPETQERGVLLGDTLASNTRRSMLRIVQGEPLNVTASFSRLSQVGVRVGEGGMLEFNRDRFRESYEQDPQAVADLLAAFELAEKEPIEVAPGVTVENTKDTILRAGIAERIEALAKQFTDSVDGVYKSRSNTMQTQIDLQNARIADFDRLLEGKRGKLQRQFLAMEQAIASLQTQQQALGGLSSLLG